jgi:hypothetical protein
MVRPVVEPLTLMNVPATNTCNPRHDRVVFAAMVYPEYNAFAVPAEPPETTKEMNIVSAPPVVLQTSMLFNNVRVPKGAGNVGVVYSVTKEPVTAVAGISTFAVMF